jgi:hypothetical protein
MNRAFQTLALCISLGMLTFLACRAQKAPPPAAASAPAPAPAPAPADDTSANPAATPAVDAAPAAPEVYFPASKSGGVFLEHQQAPK